MSLSVIKNPPVLEDLDNYEQWKEDVLMWKEVTDLAKNKQALAVHLTLKGQAKEVANQVTTEDKKKETGLDILLKKLDEAFLKEPERRKFMAYQEFEECVRKDGMSICDFMREFDTKYFKMKAKSMCLPDEVLAFRLVKNCRLTEVQKDQVMASTKPLSFTEVRATLKRMFESNDGGDIDNNQGVKVKDEPVFIAKDVSKSEMKECGLSAGGEERVDYGEDVMWTTNYGNRRGYGRGWNRRFNRSRYSRYPRRNWRGFRYNDGCFECGAKDHWARDCDKKKDVDGKEETL